MQSGRRYTAIKTMRTLAGAGCAIVLGCCVAVAFVPTYAAVTGTLACAIVASAALYAAYEGFDERLRRRPGA
ncbi:MAG: hypothetical protein NVSMB19_19060 [Vulcanimicrobiaceae bacterium]